MGLTRCYKTKVFLHLYYVKVVENTPIHSATVTCSPSNLVFSGISFITIFVITPNSVDFVANYVQDTQLSRRDRAAGCVIVFVKNRRLELGDNILRTL